MKRIAWVAICLISFLIAGRASAATYYISSSTGSDVRTTAQAQSKNTPWAHAPGMACATNNAASYKPVAGDRFVFKGGDKWGNNCFQWSWSWSGTSGNVIYLGVDQTWYMGGAWSRPILTGERAVVGGGNNLFLRLNGNYITVDNFEFTGAYWVSGYPYGGSAFINPGLSTNIAIANNYFHGWTNGDTSDSGTGIVSDSHNPSLNVNMVVSYNVFDGSDTLEVLADPTCVSSCRGSLNALWYGPIVHHNVIRYVSNGYIGAAQQFNNNLVEYIRDSISATAHENGFENNGDPCSGLLFYNNVFRHSIPGVNIWIAPQAGCEPSYAFNNVVYDTQAGNVFDVADALTNPGGTLYIYNNTIQCGPESAPTNACVTANTNVMVTVKNNHFITSNIAPIQNADVLSNNVVQTLAQANASGYTSAHALAYSPVSGTAPTIGAGENLAQSAGGKLLNLATTTSYGVAYNSNSHTATEKRGIYILRRLSGPWDAGAYQGANGDIEHPYAPTGLTFK